MIEVIDDYGHPVVKIPMDSLPLTIKIGDKTYRLILTKAGKLILN